VGNRPPSPATYRMLYATPDGRRRLFQRGDDAHPGRTGKVTPRRDALPATYQPLLDWYATVYDGSPSSPQPERETGPRADDALPEERSPLAEHGVPADALTPGERAYLTALADRLDRLQALLVERPRPAVEEAAAVWYAHLGAMKAVQGNTSNDLSFVGLLMAKAYLLRTLPLATFDVAAKAQGAPGLDIDARTTDGRRVVGELKTTTPYLGAALGAQQRRTFEKDFEKLLRADAQEKYFFLTERAAFDLVRRGFAGRLPGVTVVLLPDGETFKA